MSRTGLGRVVLVVAACSRNESRVQGEGKACKLREHATIWHVAFHVAVDGKLLTVCHVFSVCSIGIRERIQMHIIHAKGLCSYFMVTY